MQSPLIYKIRAWRSELTMAVYALLVVFVASLCVVLPARAAEPTGSELTMSPTSKRFEIKPGETTEGEFVLLNSAGVEPINVKIYAGPYTVQGEEYKPVFSKETNRTQISRWVKFPQDKFAIAPGGKVTVKYTVDVPADVPDGGQYAVLFAETDADAPEATGVGTSKRVGSLLYARVPGTTREAAEAELQMPSFIQSGSVGASVKVKNTGNVDFDTETELTVKNVFGNTVHKSDKKLAVLPDSTRKVELNWTTPPIFGVYQVNMKARQVGDTKERTTTVVVVSPALGLILLVAVLGIAGYLGSKAKIRKSGKKRK